MQVSFARTRAEGVGSAPRGGCPPKRGRRRLPAARFHLSVHVPVTGNRRASPAANRSPGMKRFSGGFQEERTRTYRGRDQKASGFRDNARNGETMKLCPQAGGTYLQPRTLCPATLASGQGTQSQAGIAPDTSGHCWWPAQRPPCLLANEPRFCSYTVVCFAAAEESAPEGVSRRRASPLHPRRPRAGSDPTVRESPVTDQS